jgi:hypothetical protein
MIYIIIAIWLAGTISYCIFWTHVLRKEMNITVTSFLLILLISLGSWVSWLGNILNWIFVKLSDITLFKKDEI